MKLHMVTLGFNSSIHGRISPYSMSQRLLYTRQIKNSTSESFHVINDRSNLMDQRRLRLENSRNECTSELINQPKTDKAATDDLLLVEEHIRPLIKEELRLTIQSKRIARGLPRTVAIEYKKPQVDEISPETHLKREKRRERNKVAAAKCRFKKKILSEQLLEESENLESVNLKLQQEIQKLQQEKDKLIYILDVHRPMCVSLDIDKESVCNIQITDVTCVSSTSSRNQLFYDHANHTTTPFLKHKRNNFDESLFYNESNKSNQLNSTV